MTDMERRSDLAERTLLHMLWELAGPGGVVTVSHQELIRHLGWRTGKNLGRSLRNLEDRGLLTVLENGPDKNGRPTARTYDLTHVATGAA